MLSFIHIRTFLKQFSVFSSGYKLVARLTGHISQITQLAFSDDGEVLASGSSDETVRVWSTTTFKLLHELRDKDLRWGQTSVVKWLQGPPRCLFIGTGRGHVVIYKYSHSTARLITSENVFRTTAVEDLAFNSSTRCLVVCDTYGEIKAYLADSNFKLKFIWKYNVPGSFIIRRLQFSGSELYAYVLHTGQRLAIDPSTGQYKTERTVPTAMGGVSTSPDSGLTLVDNLSTGFDLYTSATLSKRVSFLLPGKLNKAKDAAFIENGGAVACPAPYGAVYLYGILSSTSSPNEIIRHKNVRVVTGQSYPGRHLLASGSGAGAFDIYLWEKKIQGGKSSFIVGGLFSFQGLFNLFVLCVVLSMSAAQWPGAFDTIAENIAAHLPSFETTPTTIVYISTVTAQYSTITPVEVHPPTTLASTLASTAAAAPYSTIPDGYFNDINPPDVLYL
ncbi:WD40 repeat-like protein [Coprinopsis marcescibilis]|uniref:WD40 repeat-like protein n=1 Tax=Coprinopsis marcescibilis TaxID=230819 RepID=A0A5C3KGX3_COPMA|nr:WD40 repeat-like protein [Coprinopsis marcescibilis]